MEKLLDRSVPLNEMSSLALAFLGDAVFDLFVRDFLVSRGNSPVRKLHARAVKIVKCESQSRVVKEVLLPMLTEEERSVYMRGRNAKVNHIPKNAKIEDYHNATGLEALFGYLYLKGEINRLRELFEQMIIWLENSPEENQI